MSDDTELDDTVNSLLNQLKSVPTVAKKTHDPSNSDYTSENLEKFVIQYASRLVENAMESVEYIKDNVQAAPTAEDVISLSELIKSTSNINKNNAHQHIPPEVSTIVAFLIYFFFLGNIAIKSKYFTN